MKKINAIFLLSALILASACEKDEEEPEAPLSVKTQMLINSTWEATEYVLVDSETGEAYDMMEEEPCYGDNFLKFDKQGNFDMNEGNDICGDEEQIARGTWKFNADESKIIFTDEEGPNEVEIVELSENELAFTLEAEIYGVHWIAVFVYEAKN